MAQLLDHVDYLSSEIGARPAGTEEEQEAALYIADQFQKEAGFHAEIEEFTSGSNLEGGRAIPAIVIVLASILAMLFPFAVIPAFFLIVVSAAIYALEAFDKNYVSRALSRDVSQNVVAKYQPFQDASSARTRSRKIVLVAHYDSGRVKPALLDRAQSFGLPLGMMVVGAMAASALLMLIRIFVGTSGGPAVIVLNVLTIVALLLVALPIVKSILCRTAPYNEGANNNATGAAALIEVAHRISQGSLSEAELNYADDDLVIHGEEEAFENGLVPEGAQVVYDVQQAAKYEDTADDEYAEIDEEERLMAAKAAIAALTGTPVESKIYRTREEQVAPEFEDTPVENPQEPVVLADDSGAPAESARAASFAMTAATTVTAAAPEQNAAELAGFQNAPSWFVAAQKNAKKTAEPVSQAQKSRYNEAIDEAERERRDREKQLQEQEAQRLRDEQIAREREQQRIMEEQAARQRAAREAEEEARRQAELQARLAAEEQMQQMVQADTAADASLDAANDAPEYDQAFGTAQESDQVEAAVVDEPEVEQQAPAEQDQDIAQTPDLGSTIAFKPEMLLSKEEAALLAEEDEPKPSAPRLADLPDIHSTPEPQMKENANPSRSGMFRKLRTDIPSLSGIISAKPLGEQPGTSDADNADSRLAKPRPAHINVPAIDQAPKSEEQTPAEVENPKVDYDMEVPVSADLMQAAIADELAEEKANAAAPQAQPAEANQVEMPSSRANGFLGRLRKKDSNNLDETPQEWLQVDEDFDARQVGKERGSWESFKNESDDEKPADWQGGAFSRIRLGHVNTQSGVEEEEETVAELSPEDEENRQLNEEIEQIIHFRNPQFNTEIWFVAIGSDTELHEGAKAFLEEHKKELRGSMLIEVESLGAGVLSVASEEGQFRTVKASSRIKRFTRAATESTGIALDQVRLVGSDSIASTAQKTGVQSMHLFGAENGRPALKGDADDVAENVDELVLEENVSYLMELIKHI